VVESTPDLVRGKVIECPMLNRIKEMNWVTGGSPDHCDVFCSKAIRNLNQRFNLNFIKRMCTGDASCEYVIGPDNES
jgi:hypothetical protein